MDAPQANANTRSAGLLSQRARLIAVTFVWAWWLGLYALGAPWPGYDDLFFAGTAIQLAQGHGLANPWIKTWLAPFGTEAFLVQPPFYPLLLAGWLKLGGISDASFRLYAACCAGGISVGLLVLARRAGLAWLAATGLSLMGASWSMSVGLRPDGTGQLLCVLAAVGWSGHSRLAWLTGSICGAAAPLVMPFTATLILPLLAWHLGCAGHEPTGRFDWSGFCQRLLLAAAAGVFVFLLLVLALDSRISDFIRVFTLHARLRAATGEAQWGRLLASMCTGWEPLLRWPSLLVLATGLAGALCTANGRRRALFVAAIFTGFIVLGALLYTGYLVYLIYLAAWISAGFLIPVLPRRMSHLLLPAWGLAAGLLVLPSVVDVLWARTPPIDAPALRRAVADSLAAGNRRLLLDEFAARYVYDWQLPPGAEDWLHCHRPPARPLDPIRIANKPQGDLWLVDAAKLERHVGATGVITPKIKIGRHLSSMPLHPGDIRLIK